MISNNSIKMYLLINGSLFTIAYMYNEVLLISYIATLFFTILRNIGMSKAIEYYSTNGKQLLNADYIYPEGEYLPYIVQGSIIETTTTYLSLTNTVDTNIPVTMITFIPMSFIFEIIFDFFYYCNHRILHTYNFPWHKVHHAHIHLKPAITFYQDWVDVLLTVSLPFILTERIISSVYPLSSIEISLLVTFKIYTEICGHTGHESSPTCAFPQCIWLPKLFNIELYTEDHNLHHRNTSCNFSKRFILWDKVFGTYEPN